MVMATGKNMMSKFQTNEKAEELSSKWLADGNAAAEKGNHVKAEKCYAKSQYWLDKANEDRGWGE